MAAPVRRSEASKKQRRNYAAEYRRSNRERVRTNLAKWKAKPESQAKIRDWYYRRSYGLSAEQVAALLQEQDRKCAICGVSDPGPRTRSKHEVGRWNVDHDHATGQVRGVLCGNCNVGLGAFKDDVDVLLNAAVYLERTNGRK